MTEPSTDIAIPAPRPTLLGRVAAFVKRLGPAGPLSVAVVVLPVLGGTVLLGVLKELAPWCRENAKGVAPMVVTIAGTLLCGCSLMRWRRAQKSGWSPIAATTRIRLAAKWLLSI